MWLISKEFSLRSAWFEMTTIQFPNRLPGLLNVGCRMPDVVGSLEAHIQPPYGVHGGQSLEGQS
jgi:hypothetical protein